MAAISGARQGGQRRAHHHRSRRGRRPRQDHRGPAQESPWPPSPKDTKAALVVKRPAPPDVTLPTAALADLAGRDGKTVSISAETLKRDKSGKSHRAESAWSQVRRHRGGAARPGRASPPVSPSPCPIHLRDRAHAPSPARVPKSSKSPAWTARPSQPKLDGSCTLMVKDNSKTFSDVPDNYWGKDAIAFVTARELFNGISDDQFAPAAPMTRAMLVTVAPPPGGHARRQGRRRLPRCGLPPHWYAGAVALGRKRGTSSPAPGSGFRAGKRADHAVSGSPAISLPLPPGEPAGSLDHASAAGALSRFSDGGKVSAWAEGGHAVGGGLPVCSPARATAPLIPPETPPAPRWPPSFGAWSP
ncbi:MAG: S-layer homology domain-containing protein [Intestinimonas sp.]